MSIADENVTEEQINTEESPLFDQLLQERKDPFVVSSHLRGSIAEARVWEPKGPEDDHWADHGRVDPAEPQLPPSAGVGGRPAGDSGDREVLPRRSRPGAGATARPASSKRSRAKRAAQAAGGRQASADRPDGAGADPGVQAEAQEGS